MMVGLKSIRSRSLHINEDNMLLLDIARVIWDLNRWLDVDGRLCYWEQLMTTY